MESPADFAVRGSTAVDADEDGASNSDEDRIIERVCLPACRNLLPLLYINEIC